MARHFLEQTRYTLTHSNPAHNPYLQWILPGRHLTALPYALRPENFEGIRTHLARLELHCCSVEEFVKSTRETTIDRYNLSDIFEYMSPDEYSEVLEDLVRAGRNHGRLAYWNMMLERSRPSHMARGLRPLKALADSLLAEDKVGFYRSFVVEEITR